MSAKVEEDKSSSFPFVATREVKEDKSSFLPFAAAREVDFLFYFCYSN